jgi:DNA-binding MarR family transcriptional regulator
VSDSAPFSSLLLMVGRVHQIAEEALGSRFSHLVPAQAMFLYKMGTEPVPFGELRSRGIHLGSNASHTVAKLEKLHYIRRSSKPNDRRAVMLELTGRGTVIARKVQIFLNELETAAGAPSGHRPDVVAATETLVWVRLLLEGLPK